MASEPKKLTLADLLLNAGYELSPHDAKQCAARDAAWQAYYAQHRLEVSGHNRVAVAAIHDGFDAGWEARKRIVDYALDTSKKP